MDLTRLQERAQGNQPRQPNNGNPRGANNMAPLPNPNQQSNYYGQQVPNAGRYRPPTMSNASNQTWNDTGGYHYNLPNAFGSYQGYSQGGGNPNQGPGLGSMFAPMPQMGNFQQGFMGGPQGGGSQQPMGAGAQRDYMSALQQMGMNNPNEQYGSQQQSNNMNGAFQQLQRYMQSQGGSMYGGRQQPTQGTLERARMDNPDVYGQGDLEDMYNRISGMSGGSTLSRQNLPFQAPLPSQPFSGGKPSTQPGTLDPIGDINPGAPQPAPMSKPGEPLRIGPAPLPQDFQFRRRGPRRGRFGPGG